MVIQIPHHRRTNKKLFINQKYERIYGSAYKRSLVLVLVWCGIEILIGSFGNSRTMSKIMKNGIFILFVGVSMATVNIQIRVWA